MAADPWADKSCCAVEATPAAVDPNRLQACTRDWARRVFPTDSEMSLRFFGFADTGCTEIVEYDGAGGSVQSLPDPDFSTFALSCQLHFTTLRDLKVTDIWVIVVRNALALVFSHVLGDETVMVPKTRLLLLDVCGQSTAALPPMPEHRALTHARIVQAAASELAHDPRIGWKALQAARSARTGRRPAALPEPTVPGTPDRQDSWWIMLATLRSPTRRKIPGVLFYCTLLKRLEFDPHIRHSVMVNLRPFSRYLELTDGNTLSYLPFRADWSSQTPDEVTAEVISRIRMSEPILRRAAGSTINAIRSAVGVGERTRSDTSARDAPLTTCVSHVRMPSEWTLAGPSDRAHGASIIQTPTPNVLTINVREYADAAWYTINYQGSDMAPDRVAAAFRAAARDIGLCVDDLSWDGR